MLPFGAQRHALTLRQGGGGLLSLFGAADSGFLYPDMALRTGYLFQDSAGTTPVAADSDPVGRAVDQSGKGNNASNATAGQRAFWRANSGKPYLQLDGVDDRYNTGFATASVANTLFFAGRGALTFTFGLGALTTSSRLLLGLDSAGRICAQYGALTQSTLFGGSDIRGQDHVFMLAGDGTSIDLYLDGVLVKTSAPSGSPVSGVSMSIGSYSDSGTPGGWWSGRISAVGQINRKLNASEIAMATAALTRTYQ